MWKSLTHRTTRIIAGWNEHIYIVLVKESILQEFSNEGHGQNGDKAQGAGECFS